MARKDISSSYFLGVCVGARAVQAALVRSTPRGTKLVRRFTRQRASTAAMAGAALPGMGGDLPEVEEGEDYYVQFGEGARVGEDSLFLDSEFGDVEGFGDGDVGSIAKITPDQALFSLSLADILSECSDAGYADIQMAFCLPPNQIEHVTLTLPAGDDSSRARLLRALKDARGDATGFDAKRVGFLPMTSTPDGRTRYLALLPLATEPVVPTLQLMQNEQRRSLPPVEFIDTELGVYLALARVASKQEANGRFASIPGESAHDRPAHDEPAHDQPHSTLVVRAGDEDTLAAFVQGDKLHHVENLRSLTAFDASETICSRVLLLQDEYDIGDIGRVLVVSDQDEGELVNAFEMFFPNAAVHFMQDVLPKSRQAAEHPSAAAMGVALRMARDQRYAYAFEQVDMLPPGALKRKVKMPIAWTSIALLALLFVTVLFFTWRYAGNEQAVAQERRELAEFTTEMERLNPQELQADIDSMNATVTGIMSALEVLDELLVGSDKWSRTLAQSSRQVGAVGGIWVESWSPQGDVLRLEGNSTARSNVVGLAQRLQANIMSLTFSEIREWPVYSFTMNVPLPDELPEAAEYLRARAAAVDSLEAGAARTASYTL